MNVSRRRYMGEKGGIIPYQRIEYLQSSGTQYIDTLLYGNKETAIEVDFECLNTSNMNYSLAGARVGSDNTTCISLIFNPKSNIIVRFDSQAFSYTPTSERQTWYIDKSCFKVNGVNQKTWTSNEFTTPYTMCLFYARNNSKVSAKIYSFKVWKNGVLVMHLIPVRVEQVGYMYDTISGELFGNVGTGNFVLGPDVND